MTPEDFARERPCLDEIDGYKMGVKILIELGLIEPLTSDEIAPLLQWEKQVRAGKDLPAHPNRKGASWRYKKGRKPVKMRAI